MSRISKYILFVAAATLYAQFPEPNFKPPDPEAVCAGEQKFKSGCAACHGGNAEGGRGPSLVDNWDLMRLDDKQLIGIIQHGIPGTSMPASNLPDPVAAQVAAYVRSLSSPAFATPVSGNADAGSAYFWGSGACFQCHAIAGKGGKTGPDLSNAGSDTIAHLREALLHPNKNMQPGFQRVDVMLRNGRVISGVAKSESDFEIIVLDSGGQLNRIDKSEAKHILYLKGSEMHAVDPEHVQDLLAFFAHQLTRTPDLR